MNGGRIEQAADPITLYEAPRNLFVAAFIGAPSMNFIEGEIVRGDGGLAFRAAGDVSLRMPGDREAAYGAVIGQKVVLGIRPEHRSEEHTSELQSLMRISYAVFCLKKKTH